MTVAPSVKGAIHLTLSIGSVELPIHLNFPMAQPDTIEFKYADPNFATAPKTIDDVTKPPTTTKVHAGLTDLLTALDKVCSTDLSQNPVLKDLGSVELGLDFLHIKHVKTPEPKTEFSIAVAIVKNDGTLADVEPFSKLGLHQLDAKDMWFKLSYSTTKMTNP